MERRYTIEQANALLPVLAERLPRIREARQVMLRAGTRIRTQVEADGGGHAGTDYWAAAEILREELRHLAGLEIVLRDPESGLVDFPSEIEGRPAFLCWRLGEERVGFWHDPESGFAGRRPLR